MSLTDVWLSSFPPRGPATALANEACSQRQQTDGGSLLSALWLWGLPPMVRAFCGPGSASAGSGDLVVEVQELGPIGGLELAVVGIFTPQKLESDTD